MKLRADTLLIKLQFLVLAGIVVTQALGKASISSALFTLTFVLTVCLWLVEANRRIDKVNVLAILIVIMSCVSVAINAMVTNTIVSFSYIKKLIMFWSTILFFATLCEYRPERSVVEFVFRVNTILAVFLIVIYLTQNARMHLLNDRVTVYLTFGFTNPNLTAVFLSAVCIIEMLRIYVKKNWLLKTIHTVLAEFMVFFVFETRARNAQFLLVFFVAVYLMLMFFPRLKLRMTGWMAALIATFPLIFAVLYMLLIYTPSIQEIFSFLIGEGKDLDSRVGIWSFAFKMFASSPLLGAYSEISYGTGESQMHNSHLDVMASYGIAVFMMLCVFVYHVLYNRNMEQKSRIHFICQIGFAALLLSGIGEAMIFSGGLGVYVFLGIMLMLANYDFESRALSV